MDFKTYFMGLSQSDRQAYAQRVGTSAEYIQMGYLYSDRVPRRSRLKKMAEESNGACSHQDLIDFFYGQIKPVEEFHTNPQGEDQENETRKQSAV